MEVSRGRKAFAIVVTLVLAAGVGALFLTFRAHWAAPKSRRSAPASAAEDRHPPGDVPQPEPEPPPGVWDRYPEVARVSPDSAAALRKLPGWDVTDDWERLRYAGSRSPANPDEILDALGSDAPGALLRHLLERSETLRQHHTTSVDPAHDFSGASPGAALALRATPASDAVLFRFVADPQLHREVRVAAVVALCRPWHVAAMEPLTDLAVDPATHRDLSREILLRLPRIGLPLPPRVRAFLRTPWCRLEREAAAALAATGDPEAPSLVAATLAAATLQGTEQGNARWRISGPWLGETALLGLLCTGAERIARGDVAVAKRAAAVREVLGRVTDGGKFDDGGSVAPIVELSNSFAAWLAAHPEAFDTEFERGRAAYRDSERRRRERATSSVDAIVAAADEEWDLAAALLLLESEASEETLDALDRVAFLLEPEIAAAPTPRAKLDVLSRHLLPAHVSFELGSDQSALTTALRQRAGNCLGATSLFLALGDRLDLPLHAVAAPGHVFVRWDDGVERINLETQDRGAVMTDVRYTEVHGIDERLASSGRFLRNLTQRQFLALALSNQAWYRNGRSEWAHALRAADDALRVDPECRLALVNRALAQSAGRRPAAADVLGTVRTAERLGALTPAEALVLVGSLTRAGAAGQALSLIERRRALGESGRDLDLESAEALFATGRTRAAATAVAPLVASESKSVPVASLEVDVAYSEAPGTWRDVLAAAEARTGSATHVRLWLVARWLRPGVPAADDRLREAAAMLDAAWGEEASIGWAKRNARESYADDPPGVEPRFAAEFLRLRGTYRDRTGGGPRADELHALADSLRRYSEIQDFQAALSPALAPR